MREYLEDLVTNTKISDLEGQVITHSFSGVTAEVITHKLGRVPTNWTSLDMNVAATVHRTAFTATGITLVSSDATLVLKFYVE